MTSTMNDVAKAAGVSAMTVSNVLNGRGRVGASTRDRVESAAAELGYSLNLTARHLREGRTHTIALVVPQLDHAYFGELAVRFDRLLQPSGRHLVVEQTLARPEAERSALDFARLRLYDGVLMSVVSLHPDEVAHLRPGVPVVMLGEQEIPDRFDHVRMSNFEGARLATAHMLQTGSRRIAILGGAHDHDETSGMARTRTRGWRAAYRDAGAAVPEDLIVPLPAPTAQLGYDAVQRLLADRADLDGVFAVTDSLATGVLSALSETSLRVPADVQVIGFDDLEASRFTVPPLSTISPGDEVMATEALRLLDRLIDASPDAPPTREHLTAPASLVVRGTTR
ncbi:LacI family DNA-binding transcriptional regulator [Microbacterium sp. G2-8]|uniref:LacI family DNA-binding transcriptional regulator n=1 Tax=Microbacterium sp. G2-8 TaxID=2842454 RepID=UPI001C896629|nr:LacI family DNA-binding transcriptional regulator [Microbacterium sp. G2-8]